VVNFFKKKIVLSKKRRHLLASLANERGSWALEEILKKADLKKDRRLAGGLFSFASLLRWLIEGR